jgi:serine/threonine protein kinase
MTKSGVAPTVEEDELELTTRQLLASRERVKAGVRVETDVGVEVATDQGADPRRSAARLAKHSSLMDSRGRGPAPVQAPIRVAQESTRLGPYQVVCELASGGMATVYLALYRSIEGFEKLCAVKRIHPHLASDRAFTNMFTDEAQIAARISHPFVCSVFSFGRSQQSHYLAMEFLRGEPLSAITRCVARSPELGDEPRFPAIAARLLAHLAEGLHAAHTLRDDRGVSFDVVHRDVTPQNLFVLYDGTVRVTDFGIAHARRRLHQTEGQKLKGKLSYVAPELLNEGAVDLRVDVWGLGVTLWELLAGRRLFLGSSEGETLSAVMSRVVQPPSHFRANVPAELDRIVLRALERDVQKRYRSARDFARDLERFLNGIGDQVPSMDVADWMATVFPQGAERIQTLVELASRVSAATADETVVRVPSSPPTSLASFAVAVPKVAQHLSSLPPTREYPALARAREGQVLESEPRLPQPSRPRLALVEETTDALSPLLHAPPIELPSARGAVLESPAKDESDRWRLAVLVSGGLLLIGLASLAVRSAAGRGDEATTSRVAPAALAEARRIEPLTMEPRPAADLSRAAEAKAPLTIDSLPIEPEPATPPISKPAASARAAPVAESVALATGDVFVTTPSGSGEVSEHGRPLGHAPGRFRLSVGAHELTLRAPSGAVHTLHVNIQANAPTLVTVNGAQ